MRPNRRQGSHQFQVISKICKWKVRCDSNVALTLNYTHPCHSQFVNTRQPENDAVAGQVVKNRDYTQNPYFQGQ
jgi:hypothetical protein